MIATIAGSRPERGLPRAGWARWLGLTALKARAPGLTRGHVTVYTRDTTLA